jgi:hypothetical protein
MQAFIMAHDPCFQVIKSCDNGKYHDPREDRDLIRDLRQGRMNGPFEPRSFIFVIHKTLYYVEIW